MTEKHDKKSDKELEAEVWNAIAAFEQILEAMPNDRASLDALANAYEQIGDHVRAREHLVRLARVLLDEGDLATALELLDKLKACADDVTGAKELVQRIEESASQLAAGKSGRMEHPDLPHDEKEAAQNVRMSFNMAEELSFAWNLMEAGELTQEEYANVVQDLTEMSSGDSDAAVSVLHVLEARAFKNLERIIGGVAEKCGTPVISLSNFDCQPKAALLLPVNFMLKRGALIFDLLGKDALAVVMNPYDKQLQKDVCALAGKKCHFFITKASEFDMAVGKMAEVAADSASKQ